MEISSTTNLLWEFSVSLYKQADVADYCLALQDKYGALVNLVLLCCWAGTRDCRLDTYSIEQAEQVIADYNFTVTRPIREQRRQLSRMRVGHHAEKAQLLEQELCAEREEQDKLYTWFVQANLPSVAASVGASPASILTKDKYCEGLIVANLQCYLDKFDLEPVCLQFLAEAAVKYCRYEAVG